MTMEPRKKILVVDDSNTALLVERMILSKGAYDLVTAQDGAEALATAIAERPDLILMDIVMPKMNGFEACQALRAHPGTSETPIILVTTRGEAENIEKGFTNGCNDYVTKPINGLELLSKIKDYLGE
jgi:CheY-like chemotaxis protein